MYSGVRRVEQAFLSFTVFLVKCIITHSENERVKEARPCPASKKRKKKKEKKSPP